MIANVVDDTNGLLNQMRELNVIGWRENRQS